MVREHDLFVDLQLVQDAQKIEFEVEGLWQLGAIERFEMRKYRGQCGILERLPLDTVWRMDLV